MAGAQIVHAGPSSLCVERKEAVRLTKVSARVRGVELETSAQEERRVWDRSLAGRIAKDRRMNVGDFGAQGSRVIWSPLTGLASVLDALGIPATGLRNISVGHYKQTCKRKFLRLVRREPKIRLKDES